MTHAPPPDAPQPHVISVAEDRAKARTERDFTTADALRDELTDAGWNVVDEPGGGWRLDPLAPGSADATEPLQPHDVASRLGEPATDDVSVHWVAEGWPDDIARAIASLRSHQRSRSIHYVVADVTGALPGVFGGDVEVVGLVEGTGWGAAANAALHRATGRIVVMMDASIEATGDVFGPLEQALADPEVGIAGPFGIVTHDLREFDQTTGAGPCDAIEGYCMAMRRDVLASVQGFDEKFRWYRTADIELSFRVKDRGLRTDVVPLPVVKHEHRMWFETPPAERAKWSKRNFYRFLDRWRDRWDLVLDPRPPGDES
ncbi:MAG: glycosyltransferase [Actinomycetota bacterium]